METPNLTIQDQGDVNQQIADRVELIHKKFKGGLGEFFERLKQKGQESQVNPVEQLTGLPSLREVMESPDPPQPDLNLPFSSGPTPPSAQSPPSA